MAEWWMKGFLERLSDPSDPISKALLDRAEALPNMNPDGSVRGHLRTNAGWGKPQSRMGQPNTGTLTRSVLGSRKDERNQVDFCLDVHGDEEIPYNFIAGSEGIPSYTDRLAQLKAQFCDILKRCSPDFQTEFGYPISPPGTANMTMCTSHVAEYFDCLAMTLEQPFKDVASSPDPETGWSPDRAACFGAANVGALYEILEHLR